MSIADEPFLVALGRQAMVPVLAIDNADEAVAMATRLVDAGKPIMEFTLRSPRAIDAIASVIDNVGEAVVGVGSVLSPRQMADAESIGARFLVSPGQAPGLLDAGFASPVPYIPGVSSASEALQAREAGFRFVKFFPAQFIGGAPALAALAAPMPDMMFMPTGGIRGADVAAYLALRCVVCYGSSSINTSVGESHA